MKEKAILLLHAHTYNATAAQEADKLIMDFIERLN